MFGYSSPGFAHCHRCHGNLFWRGSAHGTLGEACHAAFHVAVPADASALRWRPFVKALSKILRAGQAPSVTIPRTPWRFEFARLPAQRAELCVPSAVIRLQRVACLLQTTLQTLTRTAAHPCAVGWQGMSRRVQQNGFIIALSPCRRRQRGHPRAGFASAAPDGYPRTSR